MRNPIGGVAFGVALALLLATGLVMSIVRYVRGPVAAAPRPAPERPLALPTTADHYPVQAGGSFTVPYRCGLDLATLSRLVPLPRQEPAESGCLVATGSAAASERSGTLRVRFEPGTLDEAMRSYDLATRQSGGQPSGGNWQRVTGLGDEALLHYSAASGRVQVHFRSGPVATAITYRMVWKRDARSEPLARRPAVNAVLQAASKVAVAIGATVNRPAVATSAPAAEPVLDVADPCALVGEAVLRAAGVDPALRQDAAGVAATTVPTRGCAWNSAGNPARQVRLLVTSFPAGPHRGGAAQAEREFVRTYHAWRKEEHTFHALSAPGEKAMAGYTSEQAGLGTGTVEFKVRNLTVQVTCSGSDGGRPLSEAAALNTAHAVAVAAADTLPG